MALYVGFDSSTQGLTATVIEAGARERRVVFEDAIDFDSAFPSYGTARGVHSHDGRTVTAPPLMWAEALDTMALRLRESGLDLERVRAVSGSAQQHGSVYLNERAGRVLLSLDPGRPLVSQLEGVFTRSVSPIWLDCSTGAECRALADSLGGDRALATLTGSRAYERFTAAQIAKFAAREPEAYAQTARIHLVSSFMASLLCGCDAPLEPGDGSGMNLMNIAAGTWAARALDATAPDLTPKLPSIATPWTIAGVLAPYWQRKLGCGPARVITWTGDNPSSLVGLGLTSPGQLGISLGTSDTVFAPTGSPHPDPNGAGHVFGSPMGGFMALTCFANGSLARERIRDAYCLDWQSFSSCLSATPPGNDGGLMVPWFVTEITPRGEKLGPHRRDLEPADVPRNVRAVVEGQAMSMRRYSEWFAPDVTTIRATGGAAVNRGILQVIADVFDAEVLRIAPPNAASLGAALRAFHADSLADGQRLEWPEVVEGFTDPIEAAGASPRREAVAAYAALLPRYAEFVDSLIG
jgi:xylulokinase